MPTIIKPLGAAVSVTTANTVNGSTLVRCYAATDAVVTVAGSVNGSFLMGPGRVDFIENYLRSERRYQLYHRSQR
jgi:hypothetical protein